MILPSELDLHDVGPVLRLQFLLQRSLQGGGGSGGVCWMGQLLG